MKTILKWGLIWSFPRYKCIKLKIISPFEDKNTSDENFKSMLQDVFREAINKLASTQFDLDNYIDESLRALQTGPSMKDLNEQKLVQIYVKLLSNIPNSEKENFPHKLWTKIEENIVVEE